MFGRFFQTRSRPIKSVPVYISLALAVFLIMQAATGMYRLPLKPTVESLPHAPPLAWLRVLGLGDEAFLSRLLVLWLQGYGYQPGISLSYKEISYPRLTEWLAASLELDPEHDYPLLLASRVYAAVNDPPRQRMMLDFVASQFIQRPAERWRWMAHAIYVAKHRLKDEQLALEYARLLTENTQPGEAPGWARQMQVFILADLGETEAAKVLLGGLVESGEMTDADEYHYLLQRIEQSENQ